MKLLDILSEGNPDPYKKYPRAHFPETAAQNKRIAAAARLKRMKLRKLQTDSGGGDSSVSGPLGSASANSTSANNY